MNRQDFTVFYPVYTRWMDNDVYGHVNNVTYYSYFDSTINRYLIEHGGLDIMSWLFSANRKKKPQPMVRWCMFSWIVTRIAQYLFLNKFATVLKKSCPPRLVLQKLECP